MELATRWTADGAWEDLPEPAPSAILLLWADTADATVLAAAAGLGRRYPATPLVGASTAGLVDNGRLRGHGILAVLWYLKGAVRTVRARARGLASEWSLARQLARAVGQDAGPILVLAEGLRLDGARLAQALTEALPEAVIFGGMAGDGERFRRTLLVWDDELQEDGVVAMVLPPAVEAVWASGCGWQPMGPVRTVTAAEGNLVLELDGEPALALYARYLGPHAADLPASGHHFPLLVTAPGTTPALRSLMAVDEARQGLHFTTAIPTGSVVRLMHASIPDVLAEAAATAARLAGQWEAALMVSCVARRHVLGPLAEDEAATVAETLALPTVGWYSYGEIVPGPCAFRNQTIGLMVLREG